MSEQHLALVEDNYIITVHPNPQSRPFQIYSAEKKAILST